MRKKKKIRKKKRKKTREEEEKEKETEEEETEEKKKQKKQKKTIPTKKKFRWNHAPQLCHAQQVQHYFCNFFFFPFEGQKKPSYKKA
jgi:hypothetical protein